MTVTLAERWERLNRLPRHHLQHPSEHVVRFLAGLSWPEHGAAIDIGCGTGRHTELLDKGGWGTFAVDASAEAVAATKARVPTAVVARTEAQQLPFRTNVFAVAIAYGVFYYGTRAHHAAAAAELHRVLRPAGRALIQVRSTRDWRAGRVGATGVVELPGEPEDLMQMDFLDETDIECVYSGFRSVGYELTETTTRGRSRCDSDWLISVTK